MRFDIKTAIPITDEGGVATMPPEFDINTALKITEPVDSEEGYDAFRRAQLHQQIKDNINRPLSVGEVKFIQDAETRTPNALQSFLIPYTEGVVGFFTKPFGYRPTLERPFGLERGPKPMAEREEEAVMAKEHPVAFGLGQLVGGMAPFIATAPLFPQSLLGTVGVFETVGLTRRIGEIRTEESLLMPPGKKTWELGKEAVKAGAMAPIWYYSGALKFIGRPYLSAIARAGVRGVGVAGLEAVFGTDLEQALKQGGMITALSLIFEAPALAKTALGRGIINRANEIMTSKGFTEPRYTIDVDKLDAAHTRVGLFDMVRAFYSTMRVKIEKPTIPIDPTKRLTYDKLAYPPVTPPVSPPEAPSKALWAPQPIAGGMAFRPQKAPVFYSKMAGALAEKMPESAPVEQVRGILASSGVPKEEMEWSGIEEFLKGKEKVSKTELLNYLQKNQLTIEETIKGKGIDVNKLRENIAHRRFKVSYAELPPEMKNEVDLAVEERRGVPKYSDPKYNVVTENYQEMLLKIPENLRVEQLKQEVERRQKAKNVSFDYIMKTQEMIDELKKLKQQGEIGYIEPHWEGERGIFAHARIADVTDAQGKKGLFVNEIQSQWALEKRKAEGKLEFKPNIKLRRIRQEELDKGADYLGNTAIHPINPEDLKKFKAGDWALYQDDEFLDILPKSKKWTQEEAEKDFLEYYKDFDEERKFIQGGIPYHPAVSRWHEIILKRLLRYAAENGYDFITWATGEQVAEYYDLTKQIDTISWRGQGKNDIEFSAVKDGETIINEQIPKEKLADYIGKDAANKILRDYNEKAKTAYIQGKNPQGVLSNVDLKVGGKWALNLYDRQIPNWLNDYAKKFGVRVETVDLGIESKLDRDLFIQETEDGKFGVFTKEELEKLGMPEKEFDTEKEAQAYIDSLYQTVQQQSLTIPPEMKQAILAEGQPVFGKMPKEIGKPGLEPEQMKIFRMDEEMKIVNTKGEIVTLPKGEEYRTLPVYDSEGNIVPNKVKLQDGKQVTVYEGELNKLKGKILAGEEELEIIKDQGPKALGGGTYAVYKKEHGINKSISPSFSTEKQAQKWLDEYRLEAMPMAGGMVHPPTPEGRKPRIEQRKEKMASYGMPGIIDKLMFSEKEFLKKYIDEGKSLKQIAKELGEDIEDVKKTEMRAYAHMQEIEDELLAEIEEAGEEEYLLRKGELKTYLQGQLNPALKKEGEYHSLAMLPWLWAKEGEGVRPDTLASEIMGMGFPIEESETDVIGLIESYFKKEIEARAAGIETQYAKAAYTKLKRGLKVKVKPEVPEREITGVGNGSIISTKEDIDYVERIKIFKGMPFALLGNKAEVLARLTKKLKTTLKQGVKKVFDLWGGGKGYRSGLFSELPAADYNLNELSDERSNYYKNIQDPEKQKVMKQTLEKITQDFANIMRDAFELPEAKSDKDFLDMLNSWLKLGLKKERYYFAKEVIQDFGDKLLQEAQADKFVSPESSAKYFFLENTSIFGVSPEGWTQGIIRTTKGDAYIRDVLDKLQGLSEKMDAETKRDQGMPVTQEDAWTKMDALTADIQTGKINPNETCVLVDPQYLNPTEEAGTYAVGQADTTWQGHKQNLEQHFLPLVETGVKIIYTNNADSELIKWLQAHKLPYNVEKAIGAMAERRGRDEIISFIGFGLGAEWTVGRIQPTGEGAVEPGQLYVAPRVTGESAKFTEWLEKREQARQVEVKKQELIAKIEQIRQAKMLSKITVSRIRKYLGIRELKNTGIEEIQKLVDYVEGLKMGDKLLSENQIKVLEKMFGEIKDIAITPKRIAIERFGEKTELMEGIITRRIALEVFPTVDIKEGHPAIIKIVNSVNEKFDHAESEIHRRDNQLEEMLRKVQNARAKKLTPKERIKRKLIKQDKEIFMALSGKDVTLTKEEVAVVAYLKNFFAMVKEKLALQKYRKNYVTHLEQPFMEKVMNVGIINAFRQYFEEQALKKEIPTDIMLELDNIIGSEKFFRFALQRKGGILPTTNIQKIIHDYSSLFETKVALDQILPEGQAITKLLLEGKGAVWLKKFLQNLKGRGLDNEFRTGRMGWLARIADGIVDLGYVKLLALNWSSAIKNIVAGEANAAIWQSFSAYLKGKQRFVSTPKKAYKMAIEHGVLEGTYADYAQRGIGKLKKLQELAMIGQKAGEIEIRTCMFVSELTDQEWETGKITQARVQELRDSIAITQGIFSKADSPLWVQTALGRMIMQMNRWRITDAMLLRRIVNGAREEWNQGNFKGQNSQRLGKALFFYTIGMYVGWELGKAGFKKAAQIAQSMAEVVNGLVSLISQGDLMRMITDNPTLSVMKEFFFTAQSVAKYLHVPGAQKPSKIKIQQGIEETYIAPLDTVKDLLESMD